MDTQALMDIACPKIRDLGWAYFFAPETFARAEELGIDGLRFYFVGRGGVLGDVDAAVVHAAFGYFEPGLIKTMWDTSVGTVAPRDAGRAYIECGAAYGRLQLSDMPGLDAYVAAAEAVNDAADPMGLALYAATAAEPLPDDAPARAMLLTSLLREFRGSAHLVAVRAAGLDDKRAQFITRPNDAAMFGWSDDDAPDITDEHRKMLEAADAITDDIVRPAYAVLDDAGQQALLDGLVAMEKIFVPS